ncbi:ABC transporter ATP-binding protein [Ferruginivarius sediminum]|nr:ABC transporter ATP-binding protein [Ferruginivarius sediminum]
MAYAEVAMTDTDETQTAVDASKLPIYVDCVTKQYLGGAFTAIDNVTCAMEENQITAIIGPSGCGKTTLLRQIAGLEYPSYGRILRDGEVIHGPGPDRGMVFQTYTAFPWLTTLQNAEYAMKINGVPAAERRERAMEHLRLVHLDGFKDYYPNSLSGGMRQRVAIARALGQDPRVLLMDEPFGALDAQVRWEMEELTVEIEERTRKTIILVTHDIQQAIYVADRIIFLTRNPGRIKADMKLEFKEGRRFLKKEELITHPGYAETEAQLYGMMREEIEKIRGGE